MIKWNEQECKKFASKYNWEYTGGFIDVVTKCNWICSNNHEIFISPDGLRKSRACKKCSKTERWTETRCIELAKEIDWQYVGGVVNARIKCEWICNKRHSVKIAPMNLLSGYRCMKCNGLTKWTELLCK